MQSKRRVPRAALSDLCLNVYVVEGNSSRSADGSVFGLACVSVLRDAQGALVTWSARRRRCHAKDSIGTNGVQGNLLFCYLIYFISDGAGYVIIGVYVRYISICVTMRSLITLTSAVVAGRSRSLDRLGDR